MDPDSPEDILSDALALLGEKPIIQNELIRYGPLELTVAPKEGKANTLLADHLFSPALYLAESIERGVINLGQKYVLELGAGCGLPSLMASISSSPPALTVVTDYEDEIILGNLARNIDRNRARTLSPVVCLGYSWGSNVSPLLELTPDKRGFDAMILSDLLHFNDAHMTLVRCLDSLLAKKSESRAYIAAGKYTRDNVCDSFFQLCEAGGFDVTERTVDVDSATWLGSMQVSDLDKIQLGIRKGMCRFWVLCWKSGFLGSAEQGRRSVDNGGLALAAENRGSGYGWGGFEDWEALEIRYAEPLRDMYNQTLNVSEFNDYLPSIDLPDDTRRRLISSLDSWNFEPHKLPDEQVLACTLILFESLFRLKGIREEVGIDLSAMAAFLCHLRNVYRWENPYHNYAHALDVLQATHKFLSSAGMVPPASILLEDGEQLWESDRDQDIHGELITCLRKHDLFALYIAAIGHDVGHPGHSNAMIKNAQAPLSIVYDGRSPLEQMHYFLLLKVMRHHGFGPFLERHDAGIHIRRLLWNTIIATDMGLHEDFMSRFENLLSPEEVPIHLRQVLVCQAIIKCADISNPSRPGFIAEYWADALTKEWASQVLLERHFALPVTVQASNDPLSVAMSQIWFINGFVLPLFSLAARAIPELGEYRDQCHTNLIEWERRSAELSAYPKPPNRVNPESTASLPEGFATVFPFTLPSYPVSIQGSPISSSSSAASGQCATDSNPASPAIPPASIPSPPSEFFTPFRSESLSGSVASPPPSAYGNNHIQYSTNNRDLRDTLHTGLRKRKEAHRSSWTEAHRSSWTPPPQYPTSNISSRMTIVVASAQINIDGGSRG